MNFSVVIPLFNKGPEIGRAVRSVLKQTWQRFELIIVDDGSTDRGPETVREFRDPRIKLVHQPNSGVSAARNNGIEKSRNRYIAFLDADDAWEPEFLSIMRNLIMDFPDAGAFATAWKGVGKSGRVTIPRFRSLPRPPWRGLIPSYFRVAVEGELLSASSVVIPMSTFLSVGKFPPGTSMGEDKDLWERIALKFRIAYSSETGATYYQNSGNRLCEEYFVRVRDGSVPCAEVEARRPILQRAREAMEKKEVAPEILQDLTEYMNDYKMTSAEISIKCLPESDMARRILKDTHPGSMRLKRRKMVLVTMSRMPYPLISWALDVKKKLSRSK